jgi:hypothetical protein
VPADGVLTRKTLSRATTGGCPDRSHWDAIYPKKSTFERGCPYGLLGNHGGLPLRMARCIFVESIFSMEQNQLNWIANFIWGIADDVLRDLYAGGGPERF